MPEENDWRESLPFELKTSDSLSKFKDVGSLAKSYTELEKMMGSRVSIPNEKSKEDEWNGFYKSWGRPEKHDEYKFPDKLPEGLSIDDEFGGSVKMLGHKLGLNQSQFNKLIEWGVEQSQGALSAQQKAAETSQKALKDEWGFRYKDNIEKAHQTLAALVGYKDDHPFIKYLETSAMGDSPEFLRFLYELNDRFGEDKLLDSDKSKAELAQGDAKKRINEIRADQKHPYWNEQDPRHMDAVKEMNSLYAKAYPGGE